MLETHSFFSLKKGWGFCSFDGKGVYLHRKTNNKTRQDNEGVFI